MSSILKREETLRLAMSAAPHPRVDNAVRDALAPHVHLRRARGRGAGSVEHMLHARRQPALIRWSVPRFVGDGVNAAWPLHAATTAHWGGPTKIAALAHLSEPDRRALSGTRLERERRRGHTAGSARARGAPRVIGAEQTRARPARHRAPGSNRTRRARSARQSPRRRPSSPDRRFAARGSRQQSDGH